MTSSPPRSARDERRKTFARSSFVNLAQKNTRQPDRHGCAGFWISKNCRGSITRIPRPAAGRGLGDRDSGSRDRPGVEEVHPVPFSDLPGPSLLGSRAGFRRGEHPAARQEPRVRILRGPVLAGLPGRRARRENRRHHQPALHREVEEPLRPLRLDRLRRRRERLPGPRADRRGLGAPERVDGRARPPGLHRPRPRGDARRGVSRNSGRSRPSTTTPITRSTWRPAATARTPTGWSS